MSTAATTATVTVAGMTCGCRVNSVSTEVGRIDRVTTVDVDLASGTVTVGSSAPVELSVIAAAVDKAGCKIAD
jgi:copper chaperone